MLKQVSKVLVGGAVVMGLLFGCSKETPVQTERTLSPAQGPGAFGMSYLKGLAKTRVASAIESGGNVNFNLGSIKGSSAFYFLLYNVGNSPITNVTLSLADTMFSVYPATMDTLIPGSDMGMLPVVKVNAFHGTSFDGVGYRSLMKQGAHSAMLSINGTTKTKQGSDTTVSLSVGLNLQALVMDLRLYGLSGAIDFASPKSTSTGKFSLPDTNACAPSTWPLFYPVNFRIEQGSPADNKSSTVQKWCYTNDIRDTTMKIMNTGNVALHIYQYRSNPVYSFDVVVAPGDSIVITTPTGSFVIDGDHTIADPRKITLQNDGKFYFQFNEDLTAPTCGTSL